MELVGWHLCRGEAALNPDDIKYVLSLGTPQARFAIECNSRALEAYFEQTGKHRISLPDPVAMSIALDPAIVTQQSENYVDVETSSELTLGMTVVDRLNVAGNDRNRAVWAPILDRGTKAKVFGPSTFHDGNNRCTPPCAVTGVEGGPSANSYSHGAR